MTNLMRSARLLVAVLVCGLVGSCGGPAAPTTGTVRGRVLYNGRPLAGGAVVFAPHPDRGPAGKAAVGTTDDAGEFRLTADGSPYLPAGWYRVAISGSPDDASFPMALRRPDRSGVEREVIAGKETAVELHIETTGP